ncbi:MAG: hypothetical protein HDR32_06635 [Treponema sp.]|nr:hypothetical protein [Treponema sp.]
MKKLAQCAVLLAFALAFVGCNTQDEKSESLQDALNDGGTVDLDEYDDFSSSKTYTISKDTTIKGSADGVNFTVANGANVTFNNTGNIGKVTVKSSGSKITLQGENVAVATVAAFANCTISSTSDTNSVGNVVVGENVTNLKLEEKTKVENLALGSDTATPVITVSKDVTIKKADTAATNALKTPDGKPANDQVKGTLTEDEKTDLKGELEESPSENFITKKEDLIKCVKNIIKKYYDFANKVDEMNSRAVVATASKDDISKQLIDAFNAVYKPFHDDEELAKSFIKLFTGAGATKNINFEGKVDLKNVGVNNGLDAFIEFANYAQDYFPSDDDDDYYESGYNTAVKKASDSEKITRESWFGSNYKTVNAFLDVADKYASVPRLYLLGKLKVNADAKGTAEYASATAKADIQIEATKINTMIPELFKVYSNKVETIKYPSSANLPVTAIKPFINVDANVVLTKNQYDDFVQKCKDMPGWEDEPEWDFQYDVYCPKYPEHPFTYPEFDWSNYTPEAYEQWQNDRNAKRQEFEEAHPDVMEEYYQALNQYYEESNAFDWKEYYQKRDEAYYEYDKKWDAEWDAWYEQHRREIKDYFLTVKYPSNACSCKINVGVSTTVTSTATVPGGIITLSLEGNYTDPGKVIAFMMGEGPMGSDYKEILQELEKDYGIVPTVTVTNNNGKQTLKLSGLNEILDIITDIVENIGDIIQ